MFMGKELEKKTYLVRWGLICIMIISVLILVSTALAFDGKTKSKDPSEKKNYEVGSLIVKFKPGATGEIKDSIHRRHGSEKVKEFRSLNIHHVRLKKGLSIEQAIKIYQSEQDVEYAEPNYVFTAQGVPNDFYFGHLWGLYNTGQIGGTAGADIDASHAWDITSGSSDVVIAVIDTGVDYNHPDLSQNMWVNLAESNGVPGVDDDGNGYLDDVRGINVYDYISDPMDDHGHGTHVSGTIGAVGNNSMGVVGVNWNVKIIPCKFLGPEGYGYTDGAVECLEYIRGLKDKGINVIATNNSWGGGGYSQALYDAIDAQRKSDILFIAAAGNENMDTSQYDSYPAGYPLPNILSVAATDPNDARAWFSNFGRRSVHVAAPGVEIVSLRAAETDMYGDGTHFIPSGDSNAQYYRANGTSMAAPHVTGLAGLIKAQDLNRSWIQIKNLILSGAEEEIIFYGGTIAGRINAYNSLTCVQKPVFSALEFPTSFQIGAPVLLSALSINCESVVGPVTVTSSSGEVIDLKDDGVPPDLAAGDGIFSASWTPTTEFLSLTFSSPAGKETVPTPSIVTNTLPSCMLNSSYNQTLIASGGVPPYTWSIHSGSLPQGLGLDSSTGKISGIPSKTGTYPFVIKVADSQTSFVMKGFSISIKEVDLIIASVSGPPSAGLGEQIAVTAAAKNQGTGDSVSFCANIYLSVDATINLRDRVLTTLCFPPLAAGVQKEYTVQTVIPTVFAPGMYYIGAIADTANRVTESNKNNNSLAGNQISVVSKVDLVITSVSGPSTASSGQEVAFTATVKNQGAANAGWSYATIYLSKDPTITRDDIAIGSGFVQSLAAGGQQTFTIKPMIPASIAPGSYYIGAIADSRNNVAESNENNNFFVGNQITISQADLIMASISGPASAISGQQMSVTATVKNQGNGTSGGFYVSVYLSTDPVITPGDDFGAGDLEIGMAYVSGLVAGGQQTLTISCTLPSILAGTYYLGAIADSRYNVFESNENNNSLAGGQMTLAK